MADRISAEQRSALMAKIKGKNSAAELRVRRLIHIKGYRFRLHGRSLPGKPDIVFGKRRKVVFVHGCFWHGHDGCRRALMPASRVAFWSAKLARNKERDAATESQLRAAGWKTMVVWECETTDPDLADRLIAFLGPQRIA